MTPKVPKRRNPSRRFINGLSLYNLTLDDLQRDWKYCGGECGSHWSYFKVACKGEELPIHEAKCICGHRITENCYITDGIYFLILGNCCVKRFIPKSGRTCADCGRTHRNRRDNLCILCRKKMTRRVGEFIISFA